MSFFLGSLDLGEEDKQKEETQVTQEEKNDVVDEKVKPKEKKKRKRSESSKGKTRSTTRTSKRKTRSSSRTSAKEKENDKEKETTRKEKSASKAVSKTKKKKNATSKAIVPVTAETSTKEKETAETAERAEKVEKFLKVVKKTTRAVNKRNKGKELPEQEKPLSAMTLKEIIRKSVEADRTDNKKRARTSEENKKQKSAKVVGDAAIFQGPSKEAIAPQVQVVDGQIVINEASLSVTAQVEPLMKPERRVEEAGNKLSAFSYSGYLTPEKWTKKDTSLFYEALQKFGTDFGLIQKLFPRRERKQIKSKFRREERSNPDKIEEALKKHSTSACVDNLNDMLKLLVEKDTEAN